MKRRRILIGILALGLIVAAVVARPFLHVALASWSDRTDARPVPPGHADDSSRLNETAVAEIVDVTQEEIAIAAVRRARERGLRVSIAGARHSQGGHTIARGGILLNMLPFRAMELRGEVLHVQSGARWCEILPFLNERGRSVLVMQSDNAFSVGGSISVNCHGWQHDTPPIGSSVAGFRLLTADGTVVRCSRDENRDLFSAVIGGYGLFGVILDVDLITVPNELYRLERTTVPAASFMAAYRERVGSDSGMVYGRLRVARDGFLDEAMLNIYRRVPGSAGGIHPLPEPETGGVRRAVFRSSVGSDYGKRLRWDAEKRVEESISAGAVSRNALLHQSVDAYVTRADATTNILLEYFVGFDQVEPFRQQLRAILPRHGLDLLNVTLRSVARDPDSMLRYAGGDRMAFVLFFEVDRTPEADERMKALTRELHDAAIAVGGTFYLPYRLHATREQFRAAYPMAETFFAAKRRFDPEERFSSAFYEAYGK